MAWSITDRFPNWGEAGEFPQVGFFYEGGDQVNEKHLDALWNGLNNFEGEVQAALNDIDSDNDGIVDEADTANLYKGNDIDSDGDGTVDNAEKYDGLAPSDGGAGNFLTTDGTNVSWQEVSTGVPSGVITMWSGTTSDIPSGWTLCDGTDSTPDLTDRFVVGAGGQYSAGDTGGSDTVQLSESEMPSHTHIQTAWNGGATGDTFSTNYEYVSANDIQATESSTQSAGGDNAHENRPPYYALAYIMKI
jgi:microcystin-dependent protein